MRYLSWNELPVARSCSSRMIEQWCYKGIDKMTCMPIEVKKICLRRALLVYSWGTLVEVSRRGSDRRAIVWNNNGAMNVGNNNIKMKLIPIEQLFYDTLLRISSSANLRKLANLHRRMSPSMQTVSILLSTNRYFWLFRNIVTMRIGPVLCFGSLLSNTYIGYYLVRLSRDLLTFFTGLPRVSGGEGIVRPPHRFVPNWGRPSRKK